MVAQTLEALAMIPWVWMLCDVRGIHPEGRKWWMLSLLLGTVIAGGGSCCCFAAFTDDEPLRRLVEQEMGLSSFRPPPLPPTDLTKYT